MTATADPPGRDGGDDLADDDAPAVAEENDDLSGEYAPSPFIHPEWTVGLVLVAGAITLLFGILVSPIWLAVGSPFLIALGLWLYVKLFVRS